MLYPKEDKHNRQLLFACRHCEHTEEASEHLVYRHELKHSGRASVVAADYAADPTLPRARGRLCPQCGAEGPVFFQDRDTSKLKESAISRVFVCCKKECHYQWNE